MDVNLIKKKSLEKYESDAPVYDQTADGKFCSRVYPDILEKCNNKENQTILDVGCGNGTMLSQVNENNRLYGIDLSQSMIEHANNKLKDRAELVVGDAEILPWTDETFDTVLCTFSFHHYPQPQKVLMEMYRVMKREGQLIIADPWLPKPLRQILNLVIQFSSSGDYHVYSKREISVLLQNNGFHIQSFQHPTYNTYLLVASK